MEIKCPKCRFRFEEDIPDFINEHSCVCPRCGTPFAYTRTESMSATEEEFLTMITGEGRTMSVRVNQYKNKLEVNMLEPLVVTVILNKQ